MTSADMAMIAAHHYFDSEFGISAVKLLPGEYFVTSRDIVLTTVLGSCVAACVRDSTAGVGGMNHFMLPEDADPSSRTAAAAMRYGAYAMKILLNELLKAGARRDRLEAKVFGGGAVLANMTMLNIGERNADFVLRYLQMEQIRIAAQDLGGKLPRRINYFPVTGRVTMRKLRHQDDALLVERGELAFATALSRQEGRNKVDIFNRDLARNATNKNVWAL